jgi:hypothetical protein
MRIASTQRSLRYTISRPEPSAVGNLIIEICQHPSLHPCHQIRDGNAPREPRHFWHVTNGAANHEAESRPLFKHHRFVLLPKKRAVWLEIDIVVTNISRQSHLSRSWRTADTSSPQQISTAETAPRNVRATVQKIHFGHGY